MTGFNEIADTGGFLVVYPTGIELSWNASICCEPAVTNNVDEPAFVRQILADLGTIASIDPKRIYALGHSNGTMLSYQLACEMSDTFAAIASVSGVLAYSPCEPSQPVSVLHVHDLEDGYIPYAGPSGLSPFGGVPNDFPPVEQGISTWVQLDGCTTRRTSTSRERSS
jgi:polyhydroxybutyrate depolymerase